MKYLIAIGVGLVFVSIFTVSCGGVSQEVYDRATENLASLNATYEQVNNDLAAKAAELESLNTQNNEANTKLDKLKIEVAIYNAVFIPALTGELDYASEAEQQQIINGIEDNIKTLNDPVLQRKYNQMKFSADSDATAEFFLYLLQDIEKTLE